MIVDILNSEPDQTIAILSAQDIIDNPENFPEPTEEFSLTVSNPTTGESVTVGTVDVSDTLVFGDTTVEGSVFLGSSGQAEDAGIVAAPTVTLETRSSIDTSSFDAFSTFDSFSAFSFFDF